MSLYPSLEDMAVGKMLETVQVCCGYAVGLVPNFTVAESARLQFPEAWFRRRRQLHSSNPNSTPTFIIANPDIPQPGTYPGYSGATSPLPMPNVGHSSSSSSSSSSSVANYPSLGEYMGLTPEVLQAYLPFPDVSPTGQRTTNAVVHSTGQSQLVAPLTGNSVGLRRAEVTQGIRAVTLCKDAQGKAGIRLLAVNNGVFVSFVMTNSLAALAGLRFGDQVLQIQGENCAGWSTEQATKKLVKAPSNAISLAVRDRPFERTITMHKDSNNRVGFGFKEGKIEMIVKDSSAARNGMLTEHNILEVNGQNVVGMKDKEVLALLEAAPDNVTLTIMPSAIFAHIVKNMSSDLIRKSMDHSVPFV